MEKNKNADKGQSIALNIGIFVLAGIVTGAAGYVYGKSQIEIVRNVILVLIGMGTVLYLLAYMGENNSFDHDNGEHRGRFLGIFIIMLLCAVVLPLIPAAGWPYLPIFIILGLFSNAVIGIVTGVLLLTITVLCGGVPSQVDFFIFFMAGTVGVILFQQLDESYRVGERLLVSLLILLTALSAGYVLFVNEVLSIHLFLIPIINLFVSFLLILVGLKYFSFSVVHKYRDKYMSLNDQGCPLLSSLREADEEEYFHGVHTAYLCDRVARKLELNDMLAKAGGYYHHIGVLKGENSWENIEEIGQEYQFPPDLIELIREHNGKGKAAVSKEAIVLILSDSVISVIRSMFQQDANVTLNYSLLLDAIFKKKIESGVFNQSVISMEEIDKIKRIFLEEKLYYDFLR